MKVRAFSFAACVLLGSLYAMAQITTTWTKTDFETGVNYGENDKIAQVTSSCGGYGKAADVFGSTIQWASPNGPVVAARTDAIHKIVPYNGMNRDIVFNGTANIYAAPHVFAKDLEGKTTTATLVTRVHCLDATNAFADYPVSQVLHVHARQPVNCVRVDPVKSQEKGQRAFDITIVLGAPAPASNTRVDLSWPTGGQLLNNPPRTEDVIQKTGSVSFRVLAEPRGNARGGTIVIRAQTAGQPKSATFSLYGGNTSNPSCKDSLAIQ